MDISIPYYEDNTRINNSAIGWFIKNGPLYLRRKLNGEIPEMKLPQLEKGTMIHEYILQPDEFWNDYTVKNIETPKSKQQDDFIKLYNESINNDPFIHKDKLILDVYNKVYSNKSSDAEKIQKGKDILTDFADYISVITNKNKKKFITYSENAMLKNIKNSIQQHKLANELLYAYADTFEVHNEFHINWEYPNASEFGDLPCKALIDRLMIDHTNKKIILIDLKTTGHVWDFKQSVDSFDYCRQLAFYWEAVYWYFKNELKLNIDEYEKSTYIIAVQTYDGNEVRVFSFNPQTIEDKYYVIDAAIKDIAWHFNNNKWDHAREYYLGKGDELLC